MVNIFIVTISFIDSDVILVSDLRLRSYPFGGSALSRRDSTGQSTLPRRGSLNQGLSSSPIVEVEHVGPSNIQIHGNLDLYFSASALFLG